VARSDGQKAFNLLATGWIEKLHEPIGLLGKIEEI